MVLKNIIMIFVSLTVLFFLFLPPFLYPFFFSLPEEEILVIGLDGGDYEVLQELMKEKKLPNLNKIVKEGTFKLFSTSSRNSYSAWEALSKCDNSSIWDKLNEKNITFGTLYWPNVPEKGLFMVPDEFEGRKEWPEDIYDSKALVIFKNPITEFFRKVYWLKIMLPLNKFEKDLVYEFYLLDKKAREFFYLREKFKPKISFFVLSSPLRIEEYFWMYAYPEKFKDYINEGEKERYGKVIENYFVEFDYFLGKINKPNKTVIIVSNMGIKEIYPPKIVDKIDINKILSEVGLLQFDYRGEIDFSKTRAYTLEEGLDQELKIFIQTKNREEFKENLKKIFENVKTLPSNQKIFVIEEFRDGVLLKRNTSLIIKDEKISILNKVYDLDDFILQRIISTEPENQAFFIINKKVELEEGIEAEDFCKILLNLNPI